MSPSELNNKRILITHTMVQNIMGSTLATLDIAKCFISWGAEIDLFCGGVADPMRTEFEKAGVRLFDDEMHEFKMSEYSLIWVNSQVIPLSIVRQLADYDGVSAPPFVFYHMSSLPTSPDEMPYIFGLEERLSSLSLFVSEEAKGVQEAYFVNRPVSGILQNCAPRGYFELSRDELPLEPKKILIVSNHVPAEVEDAKKILRKQGREVFHLGAGGDKEEVLTPDFLASFDAVVTIGKTVQFCLVSGVPVYVYDHFGGFGYLTDDNFSAAEARNFSGRGGVRKTGSQIASEIIDGYSDGARFQAGKKADFRNKFDIETALSGALVNISRKRLGPFDPPFLCALESAQRFGFRYYGLWSYSNYLKWKDWYSWTQLEERQMEIEGLREELHGTQTSSEYRFGKKMLRPFRYLQTKFANGKQ